MECPCGCCDTKAAHLVTDLVDLHAEYAHSVMGHEAEIRAIYTARPYHRARDMVVDG